MKLNYRAKTDNKCAQRTQLPRQIKRVWRTILLVLLVVVTDTIRYFPDSCFTNPVFPDTTSFGSLEPNTFPQNSVCQPYFISSIRQITKQCIKDIHTDQIATSTIKNNNNNSIHSACTLSAPEAAIFCGDVDSQFPLLYLFEPTRILNSFLSKITNHFVASLAESQQPSPRSSLLPIGITFANAFVQNYWNQSLYFKNSSSPFSDVQPPHDAWTIGGIAVTPF
eukprot:PhF_6_TR27076/c0_g1_i1/m.39497